MSDIEGELETTADDQQVATQADNSAAVQVYNPLDAPPLLFARKLEERQNNYDQLQVHLQGILVPGKDFGKIHINKDCQDKWHCTDPYHYTGYELFAPGADKILGILNLAPHYPDLKDYKRAALKGYPIEDAIVDCQILSHTEQVISEGVGACSRSEPTIKARNLNSTIKRACKRARLDAVKRLPTVSALFEDEAWLAEIEREAANNRPNSASARAQTVNQKWNTGAHLETWPKGGQLSGQRFADMQDSALDWVLRKCQNEPDIFNAAKREYDKRQAASPTPPPRTAEGPAQDSAGEGRQGRSAGPAIRAGGANDYSDYPEAQ